MSGFNGLVQRFETVRGFAVLTLPRLGVRLYLSGVVNLSDANVLPWSHFTTGLKLIRYRPALWDANRNN